MNKFKFIDKAEPTPIVFSHIINDGGNIEMSLNGVFIGMIFAHDLSLIVRQVGKHYSGTCYDDGACCDIVLELDEDIIESIKRGNNVKR